MTLRDRMTIRCAPEVVWAVLAEPSFMPAWNPKCVSCQAPQGAIDVGDRYTATFKMKGPEQEASCEVLECVPLQRLTIKYSGAGFPNGGHVEETFQLTPTSSGTRLTHAVDFGHSGIPWVFQMLIWLISTFGHTVGPSIVENIRGLTEEPNPGP